MSENQNTLVDDIQSIPSQIRNVSFIGSMGHGKTTLTDKFMRKALNYTEEATPSPATVTGKDEEGMTIKAESTFQCFEQGEMPQDKRKYLIHLMDTPGFMEYSAEVTASLRLTDGAVMILDCVEGVCMQTKNTLADAFKEHNKITLFFNKLDKCIQEENVDGEIVYQILVENIRKLNERIKLATITHSDIISNFDPSIGNVAFGSALEGWGFTIKQFAQLYSSKFLIDQNKLMEKFWGDHYFNGKEKKFQQFASTDGGKLQRCFVMFILAPIIKLARNIIEGNATAVQKMLSILNIELSKEEKELKPDQLIKNVLPRWLNLEEALLELMIVHLPSPLQAQSYKVQFLYKGPQTDECFESMQNCNKEGPLIIYVSKLVPSSDIGRFYLIGRVYSGEVSPGQKVRIMGPDFKSGQKKDLFVKNIQRVGLLNRRILHKFDCILAGNIVGLAGIDQYIQKSATISDLEETNSIVDMKFFVEPVVKVTIEPTTPTDLPKLVDGLKRLSKSDAIIKCYNEESGYFSIQGTGEQHLKTCIYDLSTVYAKIEVKQSEFIIPYLETVTSKSSQVCLAKSPNKHNRIFAVAEPLEESFIKEIEDNNHQKLWGSIELKDQLWCFGPDQSGPNILYNQTTGVELINEKRDYLETAFHWATKESVLAEECMRGVKINIVDGRFSTNHPYLQGGGQIIPAGRRVYYGSVLTANPRLLEPCYQGEIIIQSDFLTEVDSMIQLKRGVVVEEYSDSMLEDYDQIKVRFNIPTLESLGLMEDLKFAISGPQRPQLQFNQWKLLDSNPLDQNSEAGQIVRKIRKMKGLKEQIPDLSILTDKL